MNKIRSFEDLDCWQACYDVRKYVSKLVKKFPKEEVYLLTAQMKDASRSTTHNIAEGYGRYHYLDNSKFCRNSRGSLYEVIDQLITALDENYISDQEYKKGRQLIDKALKLLNGYIRYLINTKENDSMKEPEFEYNQLITNN